MTVFAYTPVYGFRLIDFNSPRWHNDEWLNWQTLDATLKSLGALTSLGAWANGIAYNIGDRVYDSTTSILWQAAVAHTSSSTGLFSDARTANPTYWTQVNQVPNYRGTWVTGTNYFPGDIAAVGNNKFYYCLIQHTASALIATDITAGKWTTIFDFSQFTSYYYGPRSTETNLRPDGSASLAGDTYYSTSLTKLRLYNGTAWQDFSVSGSSASSITVTPVGDVAATNVQAAIAELSAEKATLASPTFTGIPAGPTAAVDVSTTQLATTAYVVNQGYLKATTASSTYATLTGVAATYAARANNLSDLSNAGTARTNLGLGSFATKSTLVDSDVTANTLTLQRLSRVGNVGQVLTSNGGSLDPSYKGGMTLLASGSVASGTGVLILTLPTGYKSFFLNVPLATPAAGSAPLVARASLDGGATYIATSSYGYAYNGSNSAGTGSAGGGTTSFMFVEWATADTGVGIASSKSWITQGGTGYVATLFGSSYTVASGSAVHATGSTSVGTSGPLTHLQVFFVSQNIGTLVYEFYGLTS